MKAVELTNEQRSMTTTIARVVKVDYKVNENWLMCLLMQLLVRQQPESTILD